MLGNRLKEILDNKKMSFSDLRNLLAENEIKVSNSQLSYYANDKRKPKDKKLWVKIAEILEVDLQDLVTDINYYLLIINEQTENVADKFSKTENGALFNELISLVDYSSATEIEKVHRYCSLATNFEKLSDEIEKEGVMILVPSGDTIVKKANPAVSEQVKINAALIKLGEWFDLKRESKGSSNPLNDDWGDYIT